MFSLKLRKVLTLTEAFSCSSSDLWICGAPVECQPIKVMPCINLVSSGISVSTFSAVVEFVYSAYPNGAGFIVLRCGSASKCDSALSSKLCIASNLAIWIKFKEDHRSRNLRLLVWMSTTGSGIPQQKDPSIALHFFDHSFKHLEAMLDLHPFPYPFLRWFNKTQVVHNELISSLKCVKDFRGAIVRSTRTGLHS